MGRTYGPIHQQSGWCSLASDTGFGDYTVGHGGLIANGLWSDEEAMQSSTWRELRAVRLVLESFGPKLQNERVR